jgi:hypothetical protein
VLEEDANDNLLSCYNIYPICQRIAFSGHFITLSFDYVSALSGVQFLVEINFNTDEFMQPGQYNAISVTKTTLRG